MLQIKNYKKKDGQTYYKFQTYLGMDDSGKTVRASRQGFKTKKEARQKAMDLKAEFQESGYQKPSYEKFKEVYELWFDTVYLADGIKESTQVKTKQLFNNHILKDLGGMRVSAITPKQCQMAVKKWSEKNSKAKQMKNYCVRIFDFAIVNLQIIKNNPMEKVYVPAVKKSNRKIDFYSKNELQIFLEHVKEQQNPRWYPLFRLLAFSGIRKGEALGLEWRKINFEDNTITIDQTLARGHNNKLIIQTTKTTAGERTITIDDTTANILKEWRKQQRLDYLKLGYNTNKPSQLVFTTDLNEAIQHSNITNAMNRIIKKHDLKRITVHQLRHSHCSLLFEAGATIKEVQERLGHSSYEVTLNVYTHVTEEAKENTANKFAQYVGF